MIEKQQVFTENIGRLIIWAFSNGYGLTLGDGYRDPRLAVLDAMEGKGIVHSLHTKRLAQDFNAFKNGTYLTQSEDYKPLGDFWKSLNPLNRWGGDFVRKDGGHFSMEHGGIR